MYDDIPEGFSVTPGFSGYPAQDTPEFPTYRDYPSLKDTGGLPYKTPIPLLGRAEHRPQVFLGKTVSDVPGLVQPGTIDLTNPFMPLNKTFHIEDGGLHVVLPNWGSEEGAIKDYRETGQNLGMFKDAESADEYTQHLAKYQDLSGPKPYGLDVAGEKLGPFGLLTSTQPKTGRKDVSDEEADLLEQGKTAPESQESIKALDRQVGMVTPGNIDLDSLTPVELPSGAADTLLPMAITDTKKKQTVLIPTVIDGKQFPIQDAIRDYQKTGKHLGIFKDPIAADEYKRQLQDRQNQFYGLATNVGVQMADPDAPGGKDPGGGSGLAPSYLNGIPPKPQFTFGAKPPGMVEEGNLDINNRPIVKNPDGSISTELSFSISSDGKEVLIPSVVNGKMLSQPEAIDHFKKTGENLGKFKTPEDADAYAEQLHNRPDPRYGPQFDTQPPQEDVRDVVSNRGLLASTAKGIPIAPPSQEESDRQIEAEQAKPSVNGGNGTTYSDIPEGFSVKAPSWREDIMSELDKDPATKKLTMQMLDTEGGGKATMEALVNSTAMIRQKIPDWSLKDELTSGFYGPINRGYAQTLNLHPDTIKRYQQDIDAVRAGSNVIAGRTDQGYRGDPNWQGPGRVIPPGSSRDEIYNYWVGKRRGVDFSHEDSANFAGQVLSGGPKFADTGSTSAKQAVIQGRQYSDIPEGFSVPPEEAPQYSDIPEGFSVREEPPPEQAPVPPVDLKPTEPAPAPPPETAPAPPPETAPLKDIAPAVPSAKREVGLGESFSRENARKILGMGEALNRMVISPLLQGTSEAAKAVAPDSDFAKLTEKANRDWQTTMVDAVSSMRKSLEIDPNTEVQGLKGEAGGMIGSLFPELLGAAVTPGAIAVKFLLPAVTNGMDEMKRAREKGASPAQQIGAFAWGLASTEAFVNLPMHVQSAATGPIMRFLERTMKGTLVAGGAHEALRDINNLITPLTGGQQQPFSLKELAKTALPMGVFGGVMGEDARTRPQGPIAEQAFPKGGEPAPMPGGEERFAPGAPKGEPYDPNAPVPEEAGAGVGLVASPKTAKAAAEIKEIGKEIQKKFGLSPVTQFVRAVKGWKARKTRAAQLIEAMHKEITDALLKDVKLSPKQVKVRAEGITNYLQAGGDRATLQKWFDATTDPKLKAGYEATLNLTPREVAAAGRVRQIFDEHLHALRAMGVDVTEFKNYVTGMWQAKLSEKAGLGIPRTMSDYFRFKRQKFFENYFQGEQEGYNPKTKDIREILAHYMHAAHTTINNRQLLQDMLSMTAADGRPLLGASGSISVLPRDITARRQQAQDTLDKWREGKLRKFGERNLDRYGTASMKASDRSARIQEASSNKLEATLENLSEQRSEALTAAEEKTQAEHEKTSDRVSTKGASVQDKADYVLQERLANQQGDRQEALQRAADKTVREYGDKIDKAETQAEKSRIANEGNRIGQERARAVNKYYDALEVKARSEHAIISKTGDTAALQRQIEKESERRLNERQKAINDLFDEREKATNREHDLTVKNADTLSKSSEDLLQKHAAQQSKTFTDLINDTYAKRQKKIDKMKGMSFLIDASKIPKNLEGYKSLNFPALKNWKRMAFGQNGDPIYSKVDLLVHPDIADHLKNIFGQSTLDKWWGSPSANRLEAYSKGITKLLLKDVQSYYKGTLFAGIPSGFHAVHQAGEMGLGFQINPFRGIEKPDLINNPEHMDMANHGLMLGSDHVSQELFNEGVGGGQKNLVTLGLRQLAKVKGLGYAENVAKGIDDVSKWLFQTYIPGLGINAYRAALPRNMKRFAKELEAGTLSESDIKDLTADQVNASTGHQNMEASAIWSNKDVQQAMSTFLIAPHFTLGRVTKVFQAATSGFGIARKGREQAIGLGITAFTLWAASRVLNLITDGDPHFEWRRLFQVKVGDRWVGMRSIPGDIQRMMAEEYGGIGSGPSLYNKTTPVVHLATHWLTGRDERGRPFSLGGELHDLLLGAAPMPIQGLTNKFTARGAADPLGFWDHLAGAMGFPVQKYNPTSEVYYDARAWQKKNTPSDVNTLQLPSSRYINLEFALEENDPNRIKDELRQLQAQGMTLKDIVKNYAERIDHPYAKSQKNDIAFSHSNFADQKKLALSRTRKMALIERLQDATGISLKESRDAAYFIKRGQ